MFPRGDGRGKPSGGTREYDAMLPGKPAKESNSQPYRKPTQVGEESILRRAREPSLRNSAKWTRNFGIRVALVECKDLLLKLEWATAKRL